VKVNEFSDAFDTLLNSYASQAIFGEGASKAEVVLDEYEKSVLLTQAQDYIVKSYFYGNQNPQGQGFDDSIRRQVDFSSLIKTATLTEGESSDAAFDDRGIIYTMPLRIVSKPEGDLDTNKYTEIEGDDAHVCLNESTDVLYILNEKMIVKDADGKKVAEYVVVPLNYKEYDRTMSKAYSQPFKKQAWRLFQNSSTGFDVQSELIPLWNISEEIKKADNSAINVEYRIRYVKRPDPIVLVDLPDGLSIDGIFNATECSLNPIVHMDILNRAVEIALSTRGRVATSGNRQD
jgi:hypothetical protein